MNTLLRLLDLLISLITSHRTKELRNEATKQEQGIRSNPRDFFDDGVLNNSTGKDSTIPDSKSGEQP